MIVDRPETVSRAIARFAVGLRTQSVPEEVLVRAKLHVLDTIGVALAASKGTFAETMIKTAQSLGGEGVHPVVGRRERLTLRDAVQVNASLAHCLDYDDTHAASVVHVSAAAFPVALALAKERGASGLQMLKAYLLSIETASVIGAASGGSFHAHGFHPTGVVNAFGAAVAVGWLKDLDEAQIAAAQGIALSFASGSMEFLDSGAWTKRIHPGWAGVAGVTAATLAENGFEAPPRPYEGRTGLFALYNLPGAGLDLSGVAQIGRDWQMLKVGIKPLPACHFTHAFSDAALEIVRTHAPAPDEIAEIVLRGPAGIMDVVCEPHERKLRPLNSYEAQFSLHYIVAATIVRGRFTLDEIEMSAINDAATQQLTDKIRYEIDPHADYPRYFPGEVIVKMKDGRVLRVSHPQHRGSDVRPLSASDITEKFRDNAARVLTSAHAARLSEAVQNLDKASDLAELTGALPA